MVTALKNSFYYIQCKAADNVVDVLTVIGEGSSGFGKTVESCPQHL